MEKYGIVHGSNVIDQAWCERCRSPDLECLPFICFPTVAVRGKWKAAIFIQCLYEPDTVDRSNAAHIDTPVVPPMGPRRHNGEALCGSFQRPRALGCQFCYLLTQQCL